MIQRECQTCGKIFKTYPCEIRKGKALYCSCRCRADALRGGRTLGFVDGFSVRVTSKGYAAINLKNNKTTYLHVYLLEKHLGYSLRGYVIHHINGDKLDNRIENLQILGSGKEHANTHVNQKLVALGGTPGVHRFCSRCKQVKELSEFYKTRMTYCMECNRKRLREEYRKRLRERRKK